MRIHGVNLTARLVRACVAAAFLALALAAQGCGGGGGPAGLQPESVQSASSVAPGPLVAEASPAGCAFTPPVTSTGLVPQRGKSGVHREIGPVDLARPLPLAVKEELLTEAFSLPVYQPETEREPGQAYRDGDRVFEVYYPQGLLLAEVNETRRRLVATPVRTVRNPQGYAVEATTVDPEQIDSAFAAAAPLPAAEYAGIRSDCCPDYHAVSRFIAAKYGLRLTGELNWRAFNFAVYEAPEGADPLTVALAIQRENNDIVTGVEPRYRSFAGDYELRDYDPLLDLEGQGSQGSGIDPATNGPDYWEFSDESYGLFQANAHPVHGGKYGDVETASEVGLGFGASAWTGDTGCIPNHEDLPYPFAPAALHRIDGWDRTSPPSAELVDTCPLSHGTGVAGVIAARGNNNLGLAGVIPWGTVYPIRMARKHNDGAGIRGAVGLALQWREDHGYAGPAVFNNNWTIGIGWAFEFWRQMVNSMAADPSFVLVCCAMNDSERVSTSVTRDQYGNVVNVYGYQPQALAVLCEQAITVGAVWKRSTGEHREPPCSWSNYPQDHGEGAMLAPSLAATGYITLSTHSGGGYGPFSGTCYSAPHVTGAVALLQHYAPELTGAQIRQHIEDCARPHEWNDSGTPLETWPNDEPVYIVDIGNSMPWIAISGVPEDTVIREPLTISTAHHIPGADWGEPTVTGDNMGAAVAEFFVDQGTAVSIGVDDTPQDGFSIVFDPGAHDLIGNGPAELFVALRIDPVAPYEQHEPFVTHGIPIRIEKLVDWTKVVVEPDSVCYAAAGELAVGMDHSNRIIAGWQGLSDGEYDVRLAVQTAPGEMDFLIHTVDGGIPYTQFEDFSIGCFGGPQTVRGLYYQRLHYTNGAMGFAWGDGQDYLALYDVNAAPQLLGYGTSSLRAEYPENTPQILRDYAYAQVMLATQNSPVWDEQMLGDWPLPPSGRALYLSHYADLLRGAFEDIPVGGYPGDMRVFYGVIDPMQGQITYTGVPVLDRTIYQEWRGTALQPGYCSIDSQLRPSVVVTGADIYNGTPTYAAVYAGVTPEFGTPLLGFDLSVIEECDEANGDYPFIEGHFGSALHIPERDMVVAAFLSGVSYDSDRINLKAAFLMPNEHWYVETVDLDANYNCVAIGNNGGQVMLLYVQHFEDPFLNNVVLALEPERTW